MFIGLGSLFVFCIYCFVWPIIKTLINGAGRPCMLQVYPLPTQQNLNICQFLWKLPVSFTFFRRSQFPDWLVSALLPLPLQVLKVNQIMSSNILPNYKELNLSPITKLSVGVNSYLALCFLDTKTYANHRGKM